MKKLLFLFALLIVSAIYAVDPLGVGYDAKATPIERKAANELVVYLTKITGQKFKIVPVGAARFIVGHNFVRDKSLGNEGFRILSRKGITVIGGGTPEGRGTLYGVYEYLEQCGVRFWSRNEEYIPKLAADKLPAVNTRQIPSFPLMRFAITSGLAYGDAKLKLNGTCSGWWTKGKGNRYNPAGGILTDVQPLNCHTLMYFVPGEKYGKEHPEWYALINGNRVTTRRPVPGQMCLSNREMADEMVKNIIAYMKENGKPGTVLAVSREDNPHFCQCANCLKEDKEEHVTTYNLKNSKIAHRFGHTGSYVRFLNYVAEKLEKVYPDLKILGSAYLATGLPPKNVVLHKNIVLDLALCADLTDPENKQPDNRLFMELLPQWAKACPGGLQICDYGATFDNYLFPFPNIDAIANRLRYYKKNNVVGMETIAAHNTPGGGEFNALRNYLWAKLWWNCDLDQWEIVKEFCLGYYGKGGIHLYDYLKWYHNYLLKEKKATYYMGGNPESLYDKFYVAKAKDYFKKAYAESGNDPVFKKRLDHAYVAIDCIDMIQRKKAGDNSPERIEAVKKFEESCKRFNITNISEKENMKEFIANLKFQVPTPEFCKNVKSDKWFAHLPSCYPYWNWCSPVEDNDPNSYSKRPIKMNTNHVSWAVYKKCEQLPGAVIATGTYDAYAYVKFIHQPGANPEADGMKFGWNEGRVTKERRVKLKDVPNGKYVYVKLAENFPATLDGTIWIAPLNNEKVVKNFYVDHFIFVRKD